VFDENTLTQLEELAGLNVFSSKNDMINRCLQFGAPLVLSQIRGRRHFEPAAAPALSPDAERRLKQLELSGEDTFVLLSVIEQMLAVLYNVKHAELSGEPAAPEDMVSGRLSALPAGLETVKMELVKRYEKRDPN
jgi:hypothetical protein